MNSKKRSRCTTKPPKIAPTRPVSPFSRNSRNGKAKLERETSYDLTPLTSTASKPTLARFFRLLSKHFPSHHKLRKICNKNCAKLSYSCMPNFAAIISSHNKALLGKKTMESYPLSCNCRDKSKCPLDGRCREKSLVYNACTSKQQQCHNALWTMRNRV